MKLLCLSLMLTTGSLTMAAAVEPQTDPDPSSAQAETADYNAHDVVDRLAKRLVLTDEQKSQLVPILAERRQKIQEVRADSTLHRRQTMRQVRSIYEDSDKRINALLTPEQQRAYATYEQEMREQIKARRSQATTTAN